MEDAAVATWSEISGGKFGALFWITLFTDWSFCLLWYLLYCREQSPALLSKVKHIAVCQILWYAKGDSLGTQKWKLDSQGFWPRT